MDMLRDLCGIGVAFLLTSAAWAQNPTDVSFRLVTKNGKTKFYVGEAVEVVFQFQSTAPGRYAVWTVHPERQARLPGDDHFFVEPSVGVADPLSDMFGQLAGYAQVGRLPKPTPLSAEPVTMELQVNEWLSIRQPGHYRVTAETTRVVTTNRPDTPVPLRSNVLDIDVTAPPPGWAADQIRQAVAVLAMNDPPGPRVGDVYDPRVRQSRDETTTRAARTLRFLETPEAARALARFYEHGPEAAQGELRAGLFASPDRKQVIEAMEEQIAAPDVAISYFYLGALMELVNLSRYGPTATYTGKTQEEMRKWVAEVETPYRERSKSTEPEVFGKLADALGRKRGQALAMSLTTLIVSGPKPAPPAVVRALRENFTVLPEGSQAGMLAGGWSQIGSPEMEPLMRSLAGGNGPLRDAALVRLGELNPEAARAITLNRIRKADVQRDDYRVLLSLPDETLPEMDQLLVDALKSNKQVEELIARYASAGARSQLESWAEEIPGRICQGVLMAYFFRVDPAWAASALTRARGGQPASCAINLAPVEDLLTSPGLERKAIEDLDAADGLTRRQALTLLQYAGSADAKRAVMDAFVRSQQAGPPNPRDIFSSGIEQGFLSVLLSGSGWFAPQEMVQRIAAACATDTCRKSAASISQRLQPPIGVTLDVGGIVGYAQMGAMTIRSRKQFETKIAQFPKGTEFFLGANGTAGTWHHDRVIREATEILEKAGMKVVERPRLPVR